MIGDEAPALPANGAGLGARLVSLLIDRFALRERSRAVIAVGGESASGKSRTAEALARRLDAAGLPTAVLHQDDYYRRPPRANHEYRSADLKRVGPQEVDFERLQSHIADFRHGRGAVAAPLVDYPNDLFSTQMLDFSRVAVLVVEGTYVLQLEATDIRIVLEATHADTAARRRARNRDIDEPVIDQILAIEHAIVALHAGRADIVIDRDFAIRTG